MYEAALAECERVLGPDHPGTLTARVDLADPGANSGQAIGDSFTGIERFVFGGGHDQAIGDGDHGLNMRRGFDAIDEARLMEGMQKVANRVASGIVRYSLFGTADEATVARTRDEVVTFLAWVVMLIVTIWLANVITQRLHERGELR